MRNLIQIGLPSCSYVGVFDGHEGPRAAKYASEQLHELLKIKLQAPRYPSLLLHFAHLQTRCTIDAHPLLLLQTRQVL